jgi:Flp pilus assembly protein protease CpaA
LLIGVITSFEDFNEYRIKNKWVIIGVLYSFLVYLLVLILSKPGSFGFYLAWNIDKWCVNLAISSLAAYLLWHFRMWGAGDAKLFICYVTLIPIGQYSRVYLNYYFASFLLLMAIFIPATIYLLARSGIYFLNSFDFRQTRVAILKLIIKMKESFDRFYLIKLLLGFFFFFLLFKVVNERLYSFFGNRIMSGQNIPILISLLAFRPLAKIFSKNVLAVVFSLALLIIYIIFCMSYPWQQFILEIRNTLGKTLLIMFLFPAFNKIIDLYTDRVVHKNSPFAVWMFLGALLVWFF